MRQFTDSHIRALELPEKGSKKLFDASLPGFGIRLTKKSRTFIVQYGKERIVRTIGKYPDISLRDARREALAILDSPKPKKRSWSLSELSEAFFEHCEENLRPNTTRRYRAAIKKGPEKAKSPQEVAAFKAMYNWGLRMGHVDYNPFQHRQAIFPKRDRLLSDEEIKAIWKHEDGVFSDVVKLLILTGQRRSQMASIRKEWFDADTITFPSSIMKSKRQHTIPFNLLAAQYMRPISFNGWGKSKARMDEETGVTDWVIHDLRRYYSTTMAKIGVPLHITEHLLDHRSSTSGVQAVYMQYGFLPEMRDAVRQYECHLASLVS